MKFTPRLFIDAPLHTGATLVLTDDMFNYLSRVLRLTNFSLVLLFNGRDGEFQATCQFDKRHGTITCQTQTRMQPAQPRKRILAVSVLKPDKMELVVEKATELGVTHIQPLLCAHTQTKHINERRITAHMVEAAEQSERLDVPVLLPVMPLEQFVQSATPIFAALERTETAQPLRTTQTDIAVLIGPEGGFSEAEKQNLLSTPHVTPVSLGPTILRAETAAIVLLGAFAIHSA